MKPSDVTIVSSWPRRRRFAKAARDQNGPQIDDFRPIFSWELGWRWLPDDGPLTSFGHTRGHTPADAKDREAIQKRALAEALRYQTLIASLLL
jgi:hypothetical protein